MKKIKSKIKREKSITLRLTLYSIKIESLNIVMFNDLKFIKAF